MPRTLQKEGSVSVLPRLAPGERVCMMKGCIRVLPSEEKYRWKRCEACQAMARHRARVGKERAGEDEGGAINPSDSESDAASFVSLLPSLSFAADSFGKQKPSSISKKRKDGGSGSDIDSVEPVVCCYLAPGLPIIYLVEGYYDFQWTSSRGESDTFFPEDRGFGYRREDD